MKKNRCDSRRFWDRRSRIYDAQVIPEYKGTYKKIVKRSAHFLSQEDRILEIGCGTGNATIPLAGYVKKITAIDTSREMLDKGSVMMLSDVGTGVVLCWSALYGACLNVKVNTKSMADRAYAEAMNDEVDGLVNQYWKIAEQVYEAVMRRFS